MEAQEALEFSYAEKLRAATAEERKILYRQAYSDVSALRVAHFKSDRPEDRTAGTSERMVQTIARCVSRDDRVLEIGCGRGYTCLKLAPFVARMTGIEVSTGSAQEARQVLDHAGLNNVEIKQVSATELTEAFARQSFTLCLSIDVIEHLHPVDAQEHLRQAYELLVPGGRYMFAMPNRLNGPHDITRTVFPTARYAKGFHLNEATYREMVAVCRKVGFRKFRIWYRLRLPGCRPMTALLPGVFGVVFERLYQWTPLPIGLLDQLIAIRLLAYK